MCFSEDVAGEQCKALWMYGLNEGGVACMTVWLMEGCSEAERGHCAVKGREEERGQ